MYRCGLLRTEETAMHDQLAVVKRPPTPRSNTASLTGINIDLIGV